jgi:hypothetical protein
MGFSSCARIDVWVALATMYTVRFSMNVTEAISK